MRMRKVDGEDPNEEAHMFSRTAAVIAAIAVLMLLGFILSRGNSAQALLENELRARIVILEGIAEGDEQKANGVVYPHVPLMRAREIAEELKRQRTETANISAARLASLTKDAYEKPVARMLDTLDRKTGNKPSLCAVLMKYFADASLDGVSLDNERERFLRHCVLVGE